MTGVACLGLKTLTEKESYLHTLLPQKTAWQSYWNQIDTLGAAADADLTASGGSWGKGARSNFTLNSCQHFPGSPMVKPGSASSHTWLMKGTCSKQTNKQILKKRAESKLQGLCVLKLFICIWCYLPPFGRRIHILSHEGRRKLFKQTHPPQIKTKLYKWIPTDLLEISEALL